MAQRFERHRILAIATIQCVVASCGQKSIIAIAASEIVVARTTGQNIVEFAAPNVFEVLVGIAIDGRTASVVQPHRRHINGRSTREVDPVYTITAIDSVTTQSITTNGCAFRPVWVEPGWGAVSLIIRIKAEGNIMAIAAAGRPTTGNRHKLTAQTGDESIRGIASRDLRGSCTVLPNTIDGKPQGAAVRVIGNTNDIPFARATGPVTQSAGTASVTLIYPAIAAQKNGIVHIADVLRPVTIGWRNNTDV